MSNTHPRPPDPNEVVVYERLVVTDGPLLSPEEEALGEALDELDLEPEDVPPGPDSDP
ncbi:MAG: hypothetical protein HY903_18105 [Deltaproteobacteria bacterium]|nr:hypothetical protein [Deltaproteobacteria bacterium]